MLVVAEFPTEKEAYSAARCLVLMKLADCHYGRLHKGGAWQLSAVCDSNDDAVVACDVLLAYFPTKMEIH